MRDVKHSVVKLIIPFLIVWAICLVFGSVSAQTPPSAGNLAHLRTAGQSLVQGDLKHAEDEVQLVLKESPEDYRALNLLGIIRAQQKRWEEAEDIFKKALRINSQYAGAHVSLGLLYIEMGHTGQAMAELESALKIEPGREDASKPLVQLLREQARSALKEKELEKSLSFLMRAKKVAPNDLDLEYEFGVVALRMSLFEDARMAFEHVLSSRLADANATYGLARAQLGIGKIPASRELFEKYVQLKPDDPTGHFGLGLVLHMLEMDDEAREQFRRSIELQPAQTEAYVQLGFLDVETNDLDQAAKRFEAALRLAPQNAGALLGMGRIQFQDKEYSRAAETLLSALTADPSIREVHYYLGLTYARLGKSKESSEQLEIASQLEREDLDRHRIILKLLDPAEAAALEKPGNAPDKR